MIYHMWRHKIKDIYSKIVLYSYLILNPQSVNASFQPRQRKLKRDKKSSDFHSKKE